VKPSTTRESPDEGAFPSPSPATWCCSVTWFYFDVRSAVCSRTPLPRLLDLQFPGHSPHVVWYDDAVVASDRVGCN